MPSSNGLSVYVAIKFVSALVTPFTQWKAFKLGLINADGEKIKEPKTDEERLQFTSWLNLVRNIKRLLIKIPGGQSKLASFAVAYSLLKDSINSHSRTAISDKELINVLESFNLHNLKPVSNWINENSDKRYIVSEPILFELCETPVVIVKTDESKQLAVVRTENRELVCRREDLISLV